MRMKLMTLMVISWLVFGCSTPPQPGDLETLAAVSGRLELAISGVPEGHANVTISGPRRFQQQLSESKALTLPPGSYTTAAAPVTVLGASYTPSVQPVRTVVKPNQTSSVTVSYSREIPADAGELVVTISGLPDGAEASIQVIGPAEFAQFISSSTRLTNLTAGEYTLLPLSVVTDDGVFIPQAVATRATVTLGSESLVNVVYTQPTPLARPAPTDWREEIIYFALTDRFRNGDPRNDDGALRPDAADARTSEAQNPLGWHGGDFAGLKRAIEAGYFQDMGFTALWLTPVYLQVPAITVRDPNTPNDGQRFAGYHGYWAEDFFQVDPHLGTFEEYQALVSTAQAHGIRIIQDMVVNHFGYGARATETHPEWFHTDAECQAGDPVVSCPLAGLPDLNQTLPEVSAFLNATVVYWVENFGIDGIRMDTVKHVYDDYWAQFFAPGGPGDPEVIWTVGEIFDGNPGFIARYLDEFKLPAAFDFPLYFRIKDHLSTPLGNLDDVAVIFDQDAAYSDPSRLVTFVDNHDVPRFMSEALNRGVPFEQAVERLDAALSLIYLVRGTPSVYYGSENAMTGRGDPYSFGPFEGNRVKMDFDASRPLAGRLADLAAARRTYRALTHGAQRELWRPNGGAPIFAFRRTLAGELPVVAVLNNGDSPLDLATLPGGGIPLQGTLAPGAPLTEVTGRAHDLTVTAGGLLVGTVPPRTLLAVAGEAGDDEEPSLSTVTFTVDARSQGEGPIELRRFDTGTEQRIPMNPVAGQPGFWTVTLAVERFSTVAFKFGNAAANAKNAGYEGFGQSDRRLLVDAPALEYVGVYNFISLPAPDAAITGSARVNGVGAAGAVVEASLDPNTYYALSGADGSYYLPLGAGVTTDLTATLQGVSPQTQPSVTAPASGVDFDFDSLAAPRYTIDGDLSDWVAPKARLINGPSGYDGGFGPDNLLSELLVDWDDSYLYLGYRYRAAGNSAIIHIDLGPGGSLSAERFDAWPRLVRFTTPINLFVAQFEGQPLQLRTVTSDTSTPEITANFLRATAGSAPAYSSELAIPWTTLGFSGRPNITLNIYGGIYGGDNFGAGDIVPNANSTPAAPDNRIAPFAESRRATFETPFSVMID
jgi:glycosidase